MNRIIKRTRGTAKQTVVRMVHNMAMMVIMIRTTTKRIQTPMVRRITIRKTTENKMPLMPKAARCLKHHPREGSYTRISVSGICSKRNGSWRKWAKTLSKGPSSLNK